MEGTLLNHVQGSIARIESWGHAFTVRVTVFDVALPFFGVTVTVTRHEPFFRPFTDVPETLHTFAEDAGTLSVTLDPEATVSPAYFAIADPVADFFVVRDGASPSATDHRRPRSPWRMMPGRFRRSR